LPEQPDALTPRSPLRARIPIGLLCVLCTLTAARAQVVESVQTGRYFTATTLRMPDGKLIVKHTIKSPPRPPAGFEIQRQSVALPTSGSFSGTKTLTVPTFTWVFGCSAVSAAMIAGYYDRNGYPAMYTGPTNGGVMPLTNSSWPTWSDGSATYPSCPLVASMNGVDGRTTKGSIDDYWVQYGSSASDPYITGAWTQHTFGSAIGDYMKTSQSAYGNTDGATSFWNYDTSARLTCEDMVSLGIDDDGTLGRKLFYEAKGYTCTESYNQRTDNQVTGGFSFAQFKAEIDAGRPVLLNLEGHSVVGVGYNDSSSLVYIHDTWDYSTHTMTWGGSYSGMALQSVSIASLPMPALWSFTPTSAEAGSTVTLNGAGFESATGVTFNGVAAVFTIVDATRITATVPTAATAGRIVVTTAEGSAESSFDFTPITYDLNGDGSIDLKDLARIARYFGSSRSADPSAFQARYDLNGDGSIDEQDVTLFFSRMDQ